MVWDTDAKGNITAVPLKAFEVAAYTDDQVVLLRLEIGGTQVQIALTAQYAGSLAADLGDASARVAAAQRPAH